MMDDTMEGSDGLAQSYLKEITLQVSQGNLDNILLMQMNLALELANRKTLNVQPNQCLIWQIGPYFIW